MMKGYLAYDENMKGKRPGVLVVHEWWDLNDYARKRARMLAELGYIGYCFGGGIVLNMARQGVDLKGVASFHGNLTAVKPAQPGSVKAKILVLHGADESSTIFRRSFASSFRMGLPSEASLPIFASTLFNFTASEKSRTNTMEWIFRVFPSLL